MLRKGKSEIRLEINFPGAIHLVSMGRDGSGFVTGAGPLRRIQSLTSIAARKHTAQDDCEISRANNRSVASLVACVTVILCLIFSAQAFAGAWTKKEGGTYNKASMNFFSSDEFFDDDGDRVDSDAEFTDLNITYYLEYGVNNNLTFFASVPYKSIESEPDGGPTSKGPPSLSIRTEDFGDIDLGLKYKFYDGEKGVFSVQGLVKVPEAYDEDEPLPVGNGQYDVEVRFLYGKSLYPRPMYYGLELGFRNRNEEPSDEYKYLVEFGYNPTKKVSLRTKLDGTLSAENADFVVDPSTGNPTLAPEFDVVKLELTLGYSLTKQQTFEFSWTPVVSGKNTGFGQTFSIAFIYARE